MVHNHKSILTAIRMLLVNNYGFDGDEIDLESEIDSELTFGENWNKIKLKYVERRVPEFERRL